jgi:hypothetical protein
VDQVVSTCLTSARSPISNLSTTTKNKKDSINSIFFLVMLGIKFEALASTSPLSYLLSPHMTFKTRDNNTHHCVLLKELLLNENYLKIKYEISLLINVFSSM